MATSKRRILYVTFRDRGQGICTRYREYSPSRTVLSRRYDQEWKRRELVSKPVATHLPVQLTYSPFDPLYTPAPTDCAAVTVTGPDSNQDFTLYTHISLLNPIPRPPTLIPDIRKVLRRNEVGTVLTIVGCTDRPLPRYSITVSQQEACALQNAANDMCSASPIPQTAPSRETSFVLGTRVDVLTDSCQQDHRAIEPLG